MLAKLTIENLLQPWNLTWIEITILSLGFLGEVMFGLRFIYQWLVSEKHKKSVVPVGFWYLSICGAALILIYAIYQRDPIFILGIAPTIPIYLRNLHLIYKHRNQQPAAQP
ncbi:MAG: lipid-A-disaccharide synthase N-terminal domain-containing protein [Planctomycetes bacterium]|nr:lipid-A-disaccharide synthase N-terminal domain-containing protein [Planctomycetota bacterium]